MEIYFGGGLSYFDFDHDGLAANISFGVLGISTYGMIGSVVTATIGTIILLLGVRLIK